MALAYSHPRTRWKARPFVSLMVVALGQGALDFCAGVFAVRESFSLWNKPSALWWGMAGATLSTMAFYPLTQLYQMQDDARNGDFTLARWLHGRGGRKTIFAFCAAFFALAMSCNMLALRLSGETLWARVLIVGSLASLIYLWMWSHRADDMREDFRRVHFLLRASTLAFAALTLMLLFRR